ncbi:hypothetical protein EZV62_022651 [Acer yangbiense]|uniref:CCHC-type domain-containing protein n=1 Tax=Acer yangbiense TaxID=1000413 RepID=A0A5C7HA98_9ROSI|nr:hypothetical protein EZV62_022651 [Acer yangbiense]
MALCLAGKILSPDLVNRDAFRSLISRIWKVRGGVEIEVVTNNVYAFHFQLSEDRRKVFTSGPWNFDDSLIVLEEPTGTGSIKGLKFDRVDFWVQISNLPMLCMTKEIAEFLGGIIGEVREVDSGPTGDCLGKFVRVRVAVDITKPLRRFLHVDVLGDEEETVMPIQYERLPSFCFRCGLLGHTVHGCPEGDCHSPINSKDFLYGAWMRATIPPKPVGNREWNPRYNSGNVRRPNYGLEGGRGRNHWHHNSGAGYGSQGLAGQLVSKKKSGSNISGDLIADKSERVIKGNSNSISVLDRNYERDSGDGNSNGRDNSGSGKGKSVINKDIQVNGLAINKQDVTDGGLGPKGVFVFGSSFVKENYGGPNGADVSGLVNKLSLGHLDPTTITLEGLEAGRITDASGVEECIGPPSVASVACKKVGGNGRGVGQWKKAARKKSRGVEISNQESVCGKRKEVGTVECFMDGAKKPKVDSSSSISMGRMRFHFEEAWAADAECHDLGFKWIDDMHILDLLAFGQCTLNKDEMELMCVVLWRLWYWRNQHAHSIPYIRNEDVFAWASDYIGEFRMANLVEKGPAGLPRPVARIRWSKPDIGSFKINTDAAIKVANNQVGVGAIIRDSGGKVMVAAVQRMDACYDPSVAEAVAILFGLRVAVGRGLLPAVLESDAQSVVNLICSGSDICADIGVVLSDIRILASLVEIPISFVSRNANGAE